MYLKFSQIRPRTTDLAVLQRLKLMLPPLLGKLVAIHLIHFKFVGFEDMQHILQAWKRWHSVAGAALSRWGISCASGCLSLLSRVGTFRLVPSFSQHFGAPRLIP